MQKSLYSPKYEYPIEHNMADDPIVQELREKMENWLANDERLQSDKDFAELILTLIDTIDRQHYTIEARDEELTMQDNLLEEAEARLPYGWYREP